jgi:UDP-N-acetylglucosamine diphosphorylase/glucosamine-1-phosphate N-acetyltransferase
MIHDQIVLFEDSHAHSLLFRPLTYTRSFAELLVGCYSGLERILAFAHPESPIVLHVRPELVPIVKKRYPFVRVNELLQAKRTIFINARLLLTEHLFNQFLSSDDSLVRWDDQPEEILGFNIVGLIPKGIMHRIMSGEAVTNDDVKLTERALPKAKLFTSVWNMVNSNPVVIQSDVKRIVSQGLRLFQRNIHSNPHVDGTELKNIHVAEGVIFPRRTCLDASEGPIVIEENVKFEPNTTILGPVVIRSGSLIKAGTKIHPGVTIGPVSKIGGEVENSIIQGYSNKQHDGYLGHSFIGEWCNLGAGTNTSDLRNDYSNVKVTVEGQEFETKSLFVGLLMGDHSKSAIGTQFNTGTVCGVSSNIFCSGFPPNWIPNFSWCGPNGLEKYRADKALEVAKIVMARRGKTISEEEEALLRSLS